MKKCATCGKDFAVDLDSFGSRLIRYCPACSEKAIKEQEVTRMVQQQERLKQNWDALCPRLFHATDVHKLPAPKKLAEVLEWTYNPTGLLLHGASGKGKSRCGWLLLKREFMAGRSVRVFNAMGGIEFASQYTTSVSEATEYVRGLARADILFLDDPFKSKMTEACEAMLFAVVNERTEQMLPIIATTNDTGATLEGRLTQDRGEPLIRRLRQFCTTIAF